MYPDRLWAGAQAPFAVDDAQPVRQPAKAAVGRGRRKPKPGETAGPDWRFGDL